VRFEELRYVCLEAAADLVRTKGRPLPPTVVLPGPDRTQLVSLPALPDEDEARHVVLAELAEDRVRAGSVPCWGFIAEADASGAEVVLVVYGARRHRPHLTASPFAEDGSLAGFVPDEELDPTALPFLHPLQHAVDSLPGVGDVFSELDPKRSAPPGGGLPIVPS
jgi:hypothetical protein